MSLVARLKSKMVCGLAVIAAALPAVAAAAPAVDLYYERTLMSSAGEHCGLFTPQIGAALQASAAQARGAALRAGVDALTLNGVGARADAKVMSVGCASPDLKVAADRVRAAFNGWSKTARMDFPGEAGRWKADRTAYRSVRWKLVEASRAGPDPVLFGIAGRGPGGVLLVSAAFADGARPYAARLVYRDAARAPSPWVGAPSNRPLPPRSASNLVLAEAASDASENIAPNAREDGVEFRFPASSLAAMAALDPRERFAVEFLFADDQVRQAPFEVGDLAAGLAFLKLGPM
jgi:hypothetical protein